MPLKVYFFPPPFEVRGSSF